MSDGIAPKPRPLDGSPLTVGATLRPGDTAKLGNIEVTLLWSNQKLARVQLAELPPRESGKA